MSNRVTFHSSHAIDEKCIIGSTTDDASTLLGILHDSDKVFAKGNTLNGRRFLQRGIALVSHHTWKQMTPGILDKVFWAAQSSFFASCGSKLPRNMVLKISRFHSVCQTVRGTGLTFLPNLVLKFMGLSPELRRTKCGRVYSATVFMLCVVYETFKIYIHIRKNNFQLYMVRHWCRMCRQAKIVVLLPSPWHCSFFRSLSCWSMCMLF